MKKCLLFLTILFLGFHSISFAQIDFGNLDEEQVYRKGNKYNVWSITAGYGPVIYYTDVVDHTFLPKNNWKFGPSFNIARQFGRSVGIDLNFMMADMYGQKYNRYFEGDFREATLNLTLNINQLVVGGPIKDKWNFYAKAGFGINFFRSAQREQGTDRFWNRGEIYPNTGVNSNGYPHNYTDWHENDYLVIGYDRTNYDPLTDQYDYQKKEDRNSEILIPIGVGVKYRINKSFDLGFETTLRNLSADNLDVDMMGADNDSYMYSAFSLTYKIGKKDKRHSSWTYRDFSIDYQKSRIKDPLAERLDSLSKQLDYFVANDSIINDTILIVNDHIIKNEVVSISIFFDFDKSEITRSSHRMIANAARFMKNNPNIRVRVQGYCDDRGSYEYNERLSQRRCNAVVDVLVKDYGISRSRFETEPKGKAELLSDTRSLAPRGVHLVNRRVDIFPIFD